jgi:ABC-2 type transport system ATP-binding protein
MNQVEELCDRILMINDGRAVLYGKLDEIKRRYRRNAVFVNADEKLGELPGVVETRPHKDFQELVLDKSTTPKKIFAEMAARGLDVNRFEIATPSLNEIFLEVAGRSNE